MSQFHNLEAKSIQGQPRSLADYKGQLLMVVNVASKCGLTPQYKTLESIYRKYKDQGFTVLGFPCNQFMGQEPGSEEEIQTFCARNYDVSFDMFSKVEVNGSGRHPVYQFLAGKDARFPGDITWNFEKFVVGPDGEVLQRFSPKTPPDDPQVVSLIEANLPG